MTTALSPRTGQPPESFGRYRILKKLGQGGMGTVYLAHDPELSRLIALKIPLEEAGPETAERFRRAARAAASLQHPNICPIYEAGAIDGAPYLTMAYIDGHTLAERLRSGRPLVGETTRLVRAVALALAEAHDDGVIHRDVKPSNILINRRGEPILTDFGLAHLGTPAYMPPERVRGEPAGDDRAGDVYSLGVVLYELLTGRLPFDEPAPPSTLAPELDPRLDSICLRAMAKDPAARYPDMTAFAAALLPFVETTPTGRNDESWSLSLSVGEAAIPSSEEKKPPARPPRWPWRIVTASAVGLTAALIGFYAFTQIKYLQRSHKPPAVAAPTPNPVQPLVLRARAEYRQGNDEEAFADFIEIGRLFENAAPAPTLSKDYTDRAWCFSRIDRRDEALADCAAAVRIDPNNTAAWLLSAQTWHAQGRRDKELGAYADAWNAVKPTTAEEYAGAAQIALGLDRLDDALRACDEAVEHDPQLADAFEVRARVWMRKGDKERTAADYARAAGLMMPHEARDILDRSILYELAGDADKALADADRALELAPRLAAAFRQRGSVYRGKKDRARAVAEYRQALAALAPRFAADYFDRAWLYNELGDYDRAAADLEQALSLGLKSAEIHGELAHAYRNHKDYDKAGAYLDEALRQLPADALLYGERGALSFARGRYQDAIKDYTEALTLNPSDAPTYVNRGDAYFQSGDNRRAVEDYSQALKKMAGVDRAALADVYDRRGVAWARLKKYAEATADYNRAIDNDPDDPVLYLNRAVARKQMGDGAGADADVRRAEELRGVPP